MISHHAGGFTTLLCGVLLSFLLLVLGVSTATNVHAAGGAQLPKDTKFTCTPASDSFCGVWGDENSSWGGFPHKLAVLEINPDGTARIIYSWGLATQFQKHYVNVAANIGGNTLSADLPNGAHVTYIQEGSDTILGTYTHPKFGTVTITLPRQQ